MNLGDKIRRARDDMDLNQEELSKLVGVSRRSINAYENENVVPRGKVLSSLANALHVSVTYLTNDEVTDKAQGLAQEQAIETAKRTFGAKAGKEAEQLLSKTAALFAGGKLPEEDKDALFEAILAAYQAGKEAASARYGRKAM